MYRLMILLPLAAVMLAAGCNKGPTNVAAATNPEAGATERAAIVNIGAPIVPIKPLPPQAQPATATTEPILIPAHILITDNGKVKLPAMRDSRIRFIGTEVKPTDPPINPASIWTHPNTGKRYRPLEAGDRVERGDTVVLLDDDEAWAKLRAAKTAADSSAKIADFAKDVRLKTEQRNDMKEKLRGSGVSPIELIESAVEVARARATESSQDAEAMNKKEELNIAQTNYAYYTITSTISGTVQPFDQVKGQSVKAGETVLQIQSTDVLRAQGMVMNGYTGRLTRLMPVSIEPTIEEAPAAQRKFHTQPVNAIAVSSHAKDPYIVSVGDDRKAIVWDGRSNRETAIFMHKNAVRSVACTPPGPRVTRHYCLTGAEDGVARLWDLNAPKSGNTPVREFAGAHKGAISAVAFAPDGRTCATADARDIAIWDVEEGGKVKYKLPQLHLGEITSLTFTPQSKLVSAARDMTVRIWSLGQDGGRLDDEHRGRSGDVSQPGVSGDGRYLLLDVGQTLRLMTLGARPYTEGVVEGINETSKFANFAIFSHDSQLILTGNQNEGKLSVWRTPVAGVRATELRQFVPRERLVNFTCAAMSPLADRPFAVTGSKNGETYLWPMPTEKELGKIPGVLKYIDDAAAPGNRLVRIDADFNNPKDRPLRVGTNVTIVIEPGAK